jgi:hypothetical protein
VWCSVRQVVYLQRRVQHVCRTLECVAVSCYSRWLPLLTTVDLRLLRPEAIPADMP